MSAKKTAAAKRPVAKPARPAARKAPPAKVTPQTKTKPASKAAPKVATAKAAQPAAKAASAPKPAVKVAVVKPAPKATVVAKTLGVIKPITTPADKAASPAVKKAAAAASRARPSASAAFDPDRRRELIAAAAARHRKTPPVKTPIAPIAITARPQPAVIERHRFAVGDDVRVVSTSGMWFKHGVDYRITAALPPQAGKLQYRIKNDQEPFERVVSESQLAFAPVQA